MKNIELSKNIIETLEGKYWILCGEISEQNGQYYVEIENGSPLGEDIVETVWFDGTDIGFIEGVRELADSFDPEEHAEMWIEGRGKNGVPESIRDLLDDADAIKEMLNELADALENIDIEEMEAVL